MGFSFAAPDGVLSHFLASPLRDFRAWYDEIQHEYGDEVDPARVALLDEVLSHG
ncbi:hypothetical protein [Deinococcus multiflagellatus]|uniref:Uncharacterized protein n=1 Tax=Deinococcus multiflagellatus TaxID=1656887 RepID=A0ABW1ZGD5_9DEIO|nr:hypothetical protein [Deinococcus multiflagellatus]MBZ9712018.1 hypothetical protein [Deinococcus multiflagellatus]